MNKWINYGFGSVVAASLLAGCASTPVSNTSDVVTPSSATSDKITSAKSVTPKLTEAQAISEAIAKANIAYSANQPDKATALLKGVAMAFPANKSPWLRMTQAQFDAGNYSAAIDYALEVLKRDPKDNVANSTIVVSGLRLSTKALTDLRSQNGISGSLRTETDELAKLLRESLGQSALVAKHKYKPKTLKSKHEHHNETSNVVTDSASTKHAKENKNSDSTNPFGALK